MNGFYRVMRVIAIGIFKVIFPYRVVHKNSLPQEGRYIVCANHISMKDPVFLGITQRRQLYFMAKKELFQNKLLAFFIRKLGAFPVYRGTGDTKAVGTAFEILEQGHVLGIFPEGTRSKDGKLLRPKPGAAIFSHQSSTPILPAAIVAKNGRVRLFHRTVIVYGEPIQPEELGIDTGSGLELRNASRLIMTRIGALRERGLALLGATENRTKNEGQTVEH